MKLEIIMATMNKNKINEIDICKRNINSDVLVINQSNDLSISKEILCPGKCMYTFNETGSSKSRNRGIELCQGDICLVADDDVIYVEGYEDIIINAFMNNKSADIITFQIITPEGKPFKKNYMKKERWHNIFTALKCSSIEIVFKRESINSTCLRFDEEFGLGSKYRVHDDVIFVADALKKGLKVRYVPIPIVIHPAESSGTDYSEYLISSKGAAFIRIFGLKGVVLGIAFAFRKFYEYKHMFTFRKFIKLMFMGCFDFIKARTKERKYVKN